jgi:phospholipase C
LPAKLSRRRFLAGAATALGALSLPDHVLEALSAPAACGGLKDIHNVVILIQENRSFDHYFGTFPGVRGYSDPSALPGVFKQATPPGTTNPPDGFLLPFHLSQKGATSFCTSDITHSWAPQHACWNGGAMDSFASVHIEEDPNAGVVTMGYYTRADTPFFYALAGAFTICDGYYCSVLGPTDPNRLYSMSASIDPAGKNGGPMLETHAADRQTFFGRFTWSTMPEQLRARGISWKVYSSPDATEENNVLQYFRNFQTDPTLAAAAFTPTFPGSFEADCAAGTLPQVSWVLAPLITSEHPPAPPNEGEDVVFRVFSALTSNPGLWKHTALLVTYDENGGFFDHVPPPTSPAGTAGEWVTATPVEGPGVLGNPPVYGPIGLGFRVPLLVVSPYSRGGFVCSDTFDHTSTLRLLETRFGAEVPNLSSWRRAATGDLTSAFNFAAGAQTSLPSLPATNPVDPAVVEQCLTSGTLFSAGGGQAPPYPVPEPQVMPAQEPGTAARPSGCA